MSLQDGFDRKKFSWETKNQQTVLFPAGSVFPDLRNKRGGLLWGPLFQSTKVRSAVVDCGGEECCRRAETGTRKDRRVRWKSEQQRQLILAKMRGTGAT